MHIRMVHKEPESETGAPAETTLSKDPQHSPVKEKEPVKTSNHQELENIKHFMSDLVNSLANSMSSELSFIKDKLQEHEKTVNSLINDIFENSTTHLFSEKSPVPTSVETPFNLVKNGHKTKQLQNRQITQLANRFEALANEDNYSTATDIRIVPGQKTYSETVTHQHPPAKIQPYSQQSQPNSRQIYPQSPAAQQTSHQIQSLQNLQPRNVNQHPPSVVHANSQHSQPNPRQNYPHPTASQQTSHQAQIHSQQLQPHPRQSYPQPTAPRQSSHQTHSLHKPQLHQPQPTQHPQQVPQQNQQPNNQQKYKLNLLGDSNFRYISIRDLNRATNHRAFIDKFAHSGATTSHLITYADVALLNRPDGIVLHGGTNDIIGRNATDQSPDQIACNLIELGVKARNAKVKDIFISSVLPTKDARANEKALLINQHLKTYCTAYNFVFIDNSNITEEDLKEDERDRVHLSASGSDELMKNLAYYFNY